MNTIIIIPQLFISQMIFHFDMSGAKSFVGFFLKKRKKKYLQYAYAARALINWVGAIIVVVYTHRQRNKGCVTISHYVSTSHSIHMSHAQSPHTFLMAYTCFPRYY